MRPRDSRRARPARVLIVEANQDGTVGGSHQALFDLAERLDRSRFEPVALFYQDNTFAGRLRTEGVEVVLFDETARSETLLRRRRGRFGNLLGLGSAVVRRWRTLRSLRIDLLHLNNSPGVGNDDWLPAARLARIPCVVTAMGHSPRPQRLIHRWLYRQFDLYLAISRYMATLLLKQGVDAKLIELVYLGVDFESLRAQNARNRNSLRADLGVAPDELLVLMVGNIRPWKGQREVVAALRLLRPMTLSRLKVCFVGATAMADSDYERSLRESVAAAGLADRVSFLGSRSDVADLYRAADIAVHASTTPEPFGLVVPEAMSLGCAMIAASSGGPAEVITPGTGLLCDPSEPGQYAEALELLVNDESLRKAISAAGVERAARFSIERTVDGTQRGYLRALDGSSRGRHHWSAGRLSSS